MVPCWGLNGVLAHSMHRHYRVSNIGFNSASSMKARIYQTRESRARGVRGQWELLPTEGKDSKKGQG